MESRRTSLKSEKTTPIVLPEYLKHFKCLGSACRDHCCYGWDIAVDKITYKKLHRCRDKTLMDLFRKHVKKNAAASSDQHYAVISKIDDHCPFLTTKRLCLIQSRLGELFLPNVCALFPRHLRSCDHRMEMSASVACPEIARLALQNPGGINFVESEYNKTHLKKLRAEIIAEPFGFHRAADALSDFSMQLMKNRRFELWERLMLFGFLCKEASGLYAQGRFNEIIPLLDIFARHTRSGFFSGILTKAPVMTFLQLQTVKRLTDEKAGSIRVKAFSVFIDHCFSGLKYNTGGQNMQGIQKRYDHAYKKYFKPFAGTHGYIFENYLVNSIFSSELRATGGKGIYDQFVLSALHFAMIKTYLIGMAAFYQAPLTPDLVTDLICAFTKTIEPDARFKAYALDLLKKNGCEDVMSMAVLLKNDIK